MDLLIGNLAKRLEDKQLHLEVTDEAKQFIIDGGYDPIYGARPLKRFLSSKVETALARAILEKDPAPDTTLTVAVENGQLIVR